MPRQGNTVESCTIVEWHKNKGDAVTEGDVLFTYETDKATFECNAPTSGTLLDVFFGQDEDVPVLTHVAVVGEPGEDCASLRPDNAPTAGSAVAETEMAPDVPPAVPATSVEPASAGSTASAPAEGNGRTAVSPRARRIASAKGVDASRLTGSGPGGRVIERDIHAAAAQGVMLTPTAAAKLSKTGGPLPASETGIGGRIRAADLGGGASGATTAAKQQPVSATTAADGEVTEIKLSKLRSIVATRMMASLRETAQLTMNASADASALLAYRAKVKAGAEKLGINNITITDMVAYALTRVLPRFPEVNATLESDTIRQYRHVHLALAVDTPRGLVVPVVRTADQLSLNVLAAALKAMARQANDGSINPDLLAGGTITLSNLGTFGIESFTPILNPPQVAILGLTTITPKPVAASDGTWQAAPHIGLSLTIDHRALDGAPAARFLQALVGAVEGFDLTLAL